MIKRTIFFLFVFYLLKPVYSQDSISLPNNLVGLLLKKEQSGAIILHTNGLGAAYRYGEHITGFKKRIYELEFSTMKHPKQVRSYNPYYFNAKPYYYGKLNSVVLFRGNIGQQHVIYSKPNWGGVEIRYFYAGGASIALLKPIYLYITSYDNASSEFELSSEKYNPTEHYQDNIYGRASFTKGIDEITLKPGLSSKLGFNFEYGPYMEKLKTLEVGAVVDFYPFPIEMMAFNDPNYFFLSLYFSFHFGKRYNKFD